MTNPIIIREAKHGLPYSKGLMASSIMATGLSPAKAYAIAKSLEDKLAVEGQTTITVAALRKMTLSTIENEVGREYALRYQKWQALSKLEKPLIILIGGTTGVGKSTVATEVAHRLGITRIISTDAIREVMRSIFTEELMPALYNSSFDAWKKIHLPLPESADPTIIGFREQTSAVITGVNAIIQRAITERTNQILEGVHLVPGFRDFSSFADRAFIIPLVISVEDEELHRSHFYIRELETEGFRSFERYRSNFESIRKIGYYIRDLAQKNNIPVVTSRSLDTTVTVVLNEIVDRVILPRQGKGASVVNKPARAAP